MPNIATRLITLILMLERRPGQKAADLASQLGVSVRTLHRYFGMLDEMGVPVYAERGPYGGFSLVTGYKLPPLIFTPEEAVVLSLGTGLVSDMWGSLYAEAAQGARVKLENVLPAEQRHETAWALKSIRAVGLNRAGKDVLIPRLEVLRQSMKTCRQVSMLYLSGRNPAGETRNVDIYGLFHRSGWWYAVGYCHLREGLRTFRVDRIMEISCADVSFNRPPEFDLQAYIAQDFQDVPMVKVKMLFNAQNASLAQYARGYWDTCDEQSDGSVLVSFSAPDFNSAASNALSYGPGVRVLEPPEVRQMVCEWAEITAEIYKNNKDGDVK